MTLRVGTGSVPGIRFFYIGEKVHRRWKEPRKDADDEGYVHAGIRAPEKVRVKEL